ncbi:hypothetical protein Clacol_007664 [Clathrus columnatus]|uniref:Inosine/uridine-preferring nucleoside hydrolase domain-containing protein n=1 Tax=Clathrus columnatus TaxID=1419009 RepID=A0AAV5AGE2_9AGAM|nr:hypothetical protein Clacol_007664 [Clathrus columnatus]
MSFQLLIALLASFTTTYAASVQTAALTCPGFTPPTPAAFAVANTLQTMGYVNILGIVSGKSLISSYFPDVTSVYSLPGIDAINTWYCHPNIPMAQTHALTATIREPRVNSSNPEYITRLADPSEFPQAFDRRRVKEPVGFYRDVLSKAADNSITIVAIGFLTNLHDLYYSPGGAQLIKAKVKELVVQGGSCNTTDKSRYVGYNLLHDLPSAEVVTKWPSPVTFFPGYVAQQVHINPALVLNMSTTNPVRYVYQTVNFDFKFTIHDVLATYYAIFGLTDDLFTYGNVNGTGGLQFVPNPGESVAVKQDSVWNYAVSPPAQQRFLMSVEVFLFLHM